MDTATRLWTGRIAVVVLVMVAGVGLDAGRAVPARPALTLYGATAAEERTVDWAMRRFRAGGLEGLPPLEVVLHGSRTPCEGYLGLYLAGRIDLCTEGLLEPYARKFALHEMAHAWTDANLPDEVLDRFLRIRGIATWNDQRLPGGSGAPSRRPRSSCGVWERARSRHCSRHRSMPRRWHRSTRFSRVVPRSRLPRPDDSPDDDDPPGPNHRSEFAERVDPLDRATQDNRVGRRPRGCRSCRRCGGANDTRGVDARHLVLGPSGACTLMSPRCHHAQSSDGDRAGAHVA